MSAQPARSARTFILLAIPLAILALFLAQLSSPGSARLAEAFSQDGIPSRAFIPDRLIVKLRPEAQARIEAWAVQHNLAGEARLFRGDTLPVELTSIFRLELTPGRDVLQAAAALSADPQVEWAEPDYLAYAAVTPNDPYFSGQWALAKIAAPAAWEVVTGTQSIAIAIIDSGLDLSHPDLTSQVWVNPGEIAGNGLDDDNNGFVDDVNGWDFVNDDNAPADDNGHGTQVAGITAAATNNSSGIAGMCWGCRIMPVKVMQASGIANYSDIADGVAYAAQKGAKVINLSLGGYSQSNALHSAIQYAISVDAVVIGGAGNDNRNTAFYPAAYAEVLAVAGTDENDIKASISNSGSWVDVTAPAVAITTTFMGGDYGAVDGTSFAASFVSGLAGLVRSEHPGWTHALVEAQILHTVEAIDALNPAYAGLLGSGRIHAAQAVSVTPHPLLAVEATAVNGDPLGRPVPGESAVFQVTLGNDWLDAAGIQGVLTSSDPYVTVITGTALYGSLASGETGTGSPLYGFNVAAGAGYNHPIPFNLHVTANSGAYSVDLALTITTRSGNQNVGGTIGVDTTWTSDKTYIVISNVGVAPGVTLTIQAGTVVRFNSSYSLNVGGALVADGTEGQPVRFLSNTGGSWGRIYFDDTSLDATSNISGTYQSGNLLRWVNIEGAAQGIGCNHATPYLSHVTTDGGGVNCIGGDTALWITETNLNGDVQISEGSGVDIVLGMWTTRASMPTARMWLSASHAPNNRLYAIGGNGIEGFLATVEEYDPVTNTWITRAPMPNERQGLGVALAPNGRLYAIGGESNMGLLTIVEEYNPVTDTWITRAPMPTARRGLAVAAAPNGRLYAIGGDTYNNRLDTVEEYDPATDTWIIRTPMPTARRGLAVVAAPNGRLYAIGGEGIGGLLTTVEVYDPTTDTWITRSPMPTAQTWLGATTAPNGKIYAIGGLYNGKMVAEYDPATDVWSTRANMPTGRSYLGIAVTQTGKIFAIGGYPFGRVSYNDNYLSTVEEYTLPIEQYGYHILNSTVHAGYLSLPSFSEVQTSTIDGNITAGSNSIVQNTTTSGSITINGSGMVADSQINGATSLGSGTVQNTTVTNGGITIGSGQVLSNTLQGGGISAVSDSIIYGNNIENSPGWAIIQHFDGVTPTGVITITENRLIGNSDGIYIMGGLVQGNLIANQSGVGVELRGSTTVISNTFTAVGGSAVKIQALTGITDLSGVRLQGNNFEFNTGAYDIEDLVPKTTLAAVPASGNWWGTTDPAEIGLRTYDYADDYNLGVVQYPPAAASPIQSAPAYVQNVTIAPNPVGIETVLFDVGFNRAMDISTDPILTLYCGDRWATRASMPTPRRFLGVTAAPNGKIYAIGGSGNTSFLTTVEEYDPATNTWTTRASMPTARFALGVAAAPNGKIYAIGGMGVDATPIPTVEEYDPTTNTWATRASMPTARYSLGITAGSNGKIYAIGGVGNPDFLNTVEEYDPATNTWVTLASMPTIRHSLGVAAASNGKIYAIGGIDVYSLTTVEEYDPATNTWTTRANMPTARFAMGVTAAPNGLIYAIGGEGNGVRDTVEEYDPATDTWVARADMLTGRRDLGVTAASNGMIYAIGGSDQNPNLATVEEYTLPFIGTAFYDNQWISSDHYQAAFAITSLVPRGTNFINISGTFGTDGILIAPNTAFTFTVDYAGAIGDTTPPPTPIVQACAGNTPDTLSASWAAQDPDSEITLHSYSIGTSPGGTEVVNWTNTVEAAFTRSGLSLITGQSYYISVRSRNSGGLWSVTATAGVQAGSGMCHESVHRLHLPLIIRVTPGGTSYLPASQPAAVQLPVPGAGLLALSALVITRKRRKTP